MVSKGRLTIGTHDGNCKLYIDWRVLIKPFHFKLSKKTLYQYYNSFSWFSYRHRYWMVVVCSLVRLLFLKHIVHFHSHFYLDYLMLIIPTCITKLMKVKNYDAPCSILRMISTLGVQQLTEKIKTTHQLPYQHHHVSCFYSLYILSILDEKLVLSSSVNKN